MKGIREISTSCVGFAFFQIAAESLRLDQGDAKARTHPYLILGELIGRELQNSPKQHSNLPKI